MVRQEEEVHLQQGVMRRKMETAVNYVSSTKAKAKYQSTPVPHIQRKEQHQQSKPMTHNSAQFHSCKWCRCTSHERESCPARNVKCKSCGTMGHFVCICRKKQRATVAKEGTLVDDNDDWIMGKAVFIDAVDSMDDGSQPWLAEIKTNGTATLLVKVDNGVDMCCIIAFQHCCWALKE